MSDMIKTDAKTFRFKVSSTFYGPTTRVIQNNAETGFTPKVSYHQKGIMIGYTHNGSYWLLRRIL